MIVTSSEFFSEKELACSHCGISAMDKEFLNLLDTLRSEFGPMMVSSGYRCPEHPIEKNKANGPGAHSTGKAVDIAVERLDAYRLLSVVFSKPKKRFISGGVPEARPDFTGIGINQKGNARFIHLDIITEGFRPTVWSY
jgi:zinc D-Ala-D-Ala carboxypeptidase